MSALKQTHRMAKHLPRVAVVVQYSEDRRFLSPNVRATFQNFGLYFPRSNLDLGVVETASEPDAAWARMPHVSYAYFNETCLARATRTAGDWCGMNASQLGRRLLANTAASPCCVLPHELRAFGPKHRGSRNAEQFRMCLPYQMVWRDTISATSQTVVGCKVRASLMLHEKGASDEDLILTIDADDFYGATYVRDYVASWLAYTPHIDLACPTEELRATVDYSGAVQTFPAKPIPRFCKMGHSLLIRRSVWRGSGCPVLAITQWDHKYALCLRQGGFQGSRGFVTIPRMTNLTTRALAFGNMTKMTWNSNTHWATAKAKSRGATSMGGYLGTNMSADQMHRHQQGLLDYLMSRHREDGAAKRRFLSL